MIPCPPNLAYRPFQARCIRQMRTMRCIYLADEMGLGKTVQAVGLINDDVTLNRVLVICPACVKLNWSRELGRWLCRELTVDIAQGSQLPSTDIVIINYDLLVRHAKVLKKAMWDLVIYDEAHFIKEPTAKRTRVCNTLSARRRLFLSGTPIPNRPIELHNVLGIIDPLFWGTRHEFGTQFCDAKEQDVPVPPYHIRRFWRQLKRVYADGRWWDKRGQVWCARTGRDGYDNEVSDEAMRTAKIGRAVRTVWTYAGAQNLTELNRWLYGSCMIRRTKAEVLPELPAKTRQLVPLDCPQPNCARVLEDRLGDDYLTALAKLSVPDSPGFEEISNVWAEISRVKTQAVIEWIRTKLGDVEKLVVFAQHYEMLDALYEQFGEIAVQVDGRTPTNQRQGLIDQFTDLPFRRLFIGGLKAMGIGVNLTAASHVALAEIDHVPGNLEQAIDRCHRIGQTDPVTAYYMVLDDSLESRMARQVIAKQRNIDAAINQEKTT